MQKLLLYDSSEGKWLFIFFHSYAVKQNAAGYLIEVEVNKLVS